MTFWNLMYTWPGTVMRVLSALLFTGQIYVIVRQVRLRRRPVVVALAMLGGLLGVLVFGVMMGTSNPAATDISAPYHDYELSLYHEPWWVFVVVEAAQAAMLGLFVWDIRRYAHGHVTPDTIKQAVDLLPAGLCFGNAQGEVLLANICMNDICFALTGRPMNSVDALWSAVQQQGEAQGGQYLVRTKGGEALLFTRSAVTMNGAAYTQLIAADVTEQARVTASLQARNAELWQVQYRMKAYQARAMDMFMQEELLSARIQVHDSLGHLLLMGRYHLDHPDRTDPSELKRMLQQASGSLMAQAEEASAASDPVEEALRRMQRIGVRADVQGDLPAAGKARELIGHALGECAANAARHAGADGVSMSVAREGGQYRVTLTNNGVVPAESVREVGGLRTLRRMVEEAGGRMTIDSAPRFRLTLHLPGDT